MTKLAVDVALLPPEDIMNLIIELNHKFGSISRMNNKNNFPHITLAMGVIEDSQIELVNKRLKKICSDFNPLNLKITELSYIITPQGNKSWQCDVKLTDELRRLHRAIMDGLADIFTYDVDISMFNQDEKVDPISRIWIENFAKNHQKPEDFHAHFSIKCHNDVKFDDFPVKFTVSRVVLCHLGNYCTCRTKLGEIGLE